MSSDLASFLEDHEDGILHAYRTALKATGHPAAEDAATEKQLTVHSRSVISDVIGELRFSPPRGDSPPGRPHDSAPDPGTAERERRPEAVPAETLIFDLVLHKLVQHVAPHGEQTHHLEHAVRTLYRRLTDDLRAESAARYDKLLAELYDAQTAERARLARELHDRAGYWLSVAHRGMEELRSPAPGAPAPLPARAVDAVEGAHSAVLEAMHSLRATTTNLRLTEPVTSLETALEAALAALSTEVTVRLRMTGDEAWAPPDVKDEIFLIVREAVRNAVVHGSPGLVVVGVQIAPHELRAHVDDDGRGFAHQVRHRTGGLGLATMQERAAALNGRCTVTSAVGRGTRVEICIPLQGQTDA